MVHSQTNRSASAEASTSASVHSVSPEYVMTLPPYSIRSAYDGAPLTWITANGVTVAGPIPEPLRSYTSYEAAVLAKGAAHEPASAFAKFMASAGASKAWRDAGLEPVAEHQPTRASTD